MNTRLFVPALALFLIGGCTTVGPTRSDLVRDGQNTDNVVTYGMGYHQQRYSPLSQINKSNVKRLAPVWTAPLDNEFGEQAQPLIFNGVMYVSNAKWTMAIDALTGKVSTQQDLGQPVHIAPVVAQGRMYILTSSARLISLN